MKTTFNILILLLCLGCKTEPKNKSIYDIYNACFDSRVKVKEKPISFYINQYEKVLIEHQLLNDNSAKSYFELYNRLKQDVKLETQIDYSFQDSIRSMEVVAIQLCLPIVNLHDKASFDKSSFSHIIEVMLDENGQPKTNIDFSYLDQVITEETFKYNYFKLTVLKLVD